MDEIRTVENPADSDSPAVLRIEQLAHYFDVSRATIFREVAEGRFPILRIRRRVVVPKIALQRWIDEQLVR